MKKIFTKIKRFFTNKYTLYTMFWGYNILYLGFIGFASLTLVDSFSSVQEFLPWNVAAMLYVLLLIPISAVWFGLFTRAKREPRKLISFLFAVEIPVVFLALVRLFFIRQMTGILWLFFLSLFISMVGLIFFFVRKKIKTLAERIILFLSQEVAVIIGLYLFLLAVFFLPIIIALIARGLIEFDFGDILYALVQTKGLAFFSFLFFLLLFCATVGLLMITPVVAFVIYWRSFRSNKKELIGGQFKYKYTKPLQYTFGFVYVIIAIFFATQWHGDSYATTMNKYFEANSFEQQQQFAAELVDSDKRIQKVLRNEYLAPYRFLSDDTMNVLERGYTKQLKVPESAASGIQSFFNVVALPFVYQSDFEKDSEQAKEQYPKLFDVPLQEGESRELISAMKATNTQDQLKAGILDEERKTVRLASRTTKATTEQGGLFARVSVEEEYENTSDTIQEVYYEFSLPENAVIVGLWLGPELEETGVIAPKGAARRTYEQQVRRRVDPALLEQTGPRQYRLRVFPIPVKPSLLERQRGFDNGQVDERNQRIKFEYVTFVSPEGVQLPKIVTRRNVYEDKKSNVQYFIDGQKKNSFVSSVNHCGDKPFTVETSIGAVSFIPHHLVQPTNIYNCAKLSFDSFPDIHDKKIAFLFDASYSNEPIDWTEYLKEQLPMNSLVENNNIDAYFFSTKLSQPTRLTVERLQNELSAVHFGGTDRLNALRSLSGEYDAVIMFTDESDSDIEPQDGLSFSPKSPVYVVHVNNKFPQYNDDLTKAIIQSGGGVFSSVWKVFGYIALAQNSQVLDGELISVDRYGSWILSDGSANLFGNMDDIFANDQAIRQLIQIDENNIEQIHQVAQTHGIVSPYSSYIALVTDQQKQQLKKESQKDNKFEADYDVGEENISDPSMSGALSLGAVPEPEEWALMITAVLLFGYLYRREIMRWVFQKR